MKPLKEILYDALRLKASDIHLTVGLPPVFRLDGRLTNIDEEALLSHQEQIEVIPTFVLYKDGKAVSSIVAPESRAAIEEFLREGLR